MIAEMDMKNISQKNKKKVFGSIANPYLCTII